MASQNEPITLDALQRYFAKRLDEKGPSHEAVDWGSAERQQLAFGQCLGSSKTQRLARSLVVSRYSIMAAATALCCSTLASADLTSRLTQDTT